MESSSTGSSAICGAASARAPRSASCGRRWGLTYATSSRRCASRHWCWRRPIGANRRRMSPPGSVAASLLCCRPCEDFSRGSTSRRTRAMDETERFVARVGQVASPDPVLATVLFTDIVSSTDRAAELGDRAWRELLERHHALMRRRLAEFRGDELDTAGDGFLAAFDGPGRAIQCALAFMRDVPALGLEVRAGVHTGECERLDGKLAGIAVAVGARIASMAKPGEILVSGTVQDLVDGSPFVFEDRGAHELKGVPGSWRLAALLAPR